MILGEITTKEEVKDQVMQWNFNASIFDVYDEIKYISEDIQKKLLQCCHDTYSCEDSRKMVSDLADHLNVDIDAA